MRAWAVSPPVPNPGVAAPISDLAEALALGTTAIAEYAAAHGIDTEEARRRLERSGQAGRRLSRVMREII
jgi:hypothetical protein